MTLLSIFTAVLIAVPACSNAAPRSIDECEKIQAADAYNQCLAVFGPVARTHGVARETADTGNQDEGVAATGADTKAAAAPDEDLGRGHGRRHGSMRHRWARHGHAAHGFAHHGHWHHSTASAHTHGKRTTLAFSTVSSHRHLR
ncbi:MAG TPA: hypothetical protein VFC11_06725 [Methylocella sp.]|nr:hypothetical protein [Methylocella sp.]